MRLPRPEILFALCAATTGSLAQDSLRERVNQALDAARPALLGHLRAASDPSQRPGELALIVLAATHDGLDGADDVYQRAMTRLGRADPSETYDLALRLMVLEAVPTFPGRDELAAADAKELLLHRHKSGTFGYGRTPGGWDLSNTQYSALGLRSARALGVKIDRAVWSRLASEIGAQQDSYGGFNYGRNDSGFGSYASMTAAGIAVLATCRQELDAGGQAPQSLAGRIERGWQWFARNTATIGSPRERWSFYFHYGLERAAILCDIEKVGEVGWYERGAAMLCDLQLPGGGWQSRSDGHPGGHLASGRGDLVPTAFAVLFLRRKFQKISGPVTPQVVRLVNIGPASKPGDVDACASELVRRGKPALPEVFQALRSEVELQRRAAAAALAGIAGDNFGYDAAKDAAANRDAVVRAELWFLKNR
ncbi:MAG: hypothetical protein WAT39_02625 [Planctomycetota bacterium]